MSDKDEKRITIEDEAYQTLSVLVVKQKKEIKELSDKLKLQVEFRASDLKCAIEREEEIKEFKKEIKELKEWKENQVKMIANNIPEHEKQTSFVKLAISVKGVITGEAKCYDDDMNVAWDKTTEIIRKVQDLNKDITF